MFSWFIMPSQQQFYQIPFDTYSFCLPLAAVLLPFKVISSAFCALFTLPLYSCHVVIYQCSRSQVSSGRCQLYRCLHNMLVTLMLLPLLLSNTNIWHCTCLPLLLICHFCCLVCIICFNVSWPVSGAYLSLAMFVAVACKLIRTVGYLVVCDIAAPYGYFHSS